MKSQKTSKVEKNLDKPFPIWVLLLIPFYAGGFLAIFIFPIAKDWRWLEGWLFIISIAINLGIGYFLINKENPRVMRNRMKMKKEGLTAATRKSAGSDRFIMPLMSLGFFCALIIPPLEHRLGWKSISLIIEMIGLILSNIGVAIINIAQLHNAFASKILDINQGQKLIDTGIYAYVRHPLYTGAILMIMAMPIALGSWWALIPAAFGSSTLILRIKYEEDMLEKGMEGYEEYQKRVRYKLIPGIY